DGPAAGAAGIGDDVDAVREEQVAGAEAVGAGGEEVVEVLELGGQADVELVVGEVAGVVDQGVGALAEVGAVEDVEDAVEDEVAVHDEEITVWAAAGLVEVEVQLGVVGER